MNKYLEKIALNATKAREVAKKTGLIPDGNWKWALRKLKDNKGHALEGEALEKARVGLGAMKSDSFEKLRKAQAANPEIEMGYSVNNGGNISSVFRGNSHGIKVDNKKLPKNTFFGHTHPNRKVINDFKMDGGDHLVTRPSGVYSHTEFPHINNSRVIPKKKSNALYSDWLRNELRTDVKNKKISPSAAKDVWKTYSPKTLTDTRGDVRAGIISQP